VNFFRIRKSQSQGTEVKKALGPGKTGGGTTFRDGLVANHGEKTRHDQRNCGLEVFNAEGAVEWTQHERGDLDSTRIDYCSPTEFSVQKK